MSCAEPCHQDFHFPFHGKSVGNKVASTIAAAYESLGFSSLADTFGAWYVSRTPTGNVIEDETPSRKDRTELATTGSVFDGTNYFEKTDIDDAVLATDNTAFTVRVVFEGQAGLGLSAHIIHAFDGSPDEGFRIGIVNDDLMFSIKDEANATVSAETGISSATIVSAGVYEVVGTYDPVAELISVYVNGSLVNTKPATSFKGPEQNRIRIGCRSDLVTHRWDGNVYEAQVWNDQALTAAEVVKLYDKEISYFQNDKAPSVAWLLDGPTCTDLIGDNDLTPVADPAAYVGSEGSSWLNDQGYNPRKRLQTNGDFDTWTTGWTAVSGAALSWDAGKAKITYSGSAVNAGISQDLGASKPAGTVRVTGDIVLVSGGLTSGEFTVRNAYDTVTRTGLTGSGSFDVEISTGGATNQIWIYGYATDIVFTVDNIRIIDESQNVPKRWDADLDTDGYAADDANSFGPCKRNREYRNGPAIDLDGSQYATVADSAPFLLTGDLTAACWIYPDTVSGDRTIFAFGKSGELEADNVLYRLYSKSGATGTVSYIHEYGAGINEESAFATTIAAATPVHLAIVRDDTAKTVKLYVNGVFAETFTYTNSPTGGTSGIFTVGNFASGTHFAGKIWATHVYNATKTDAEIAAIYAGELDKENAVEIWPISEEVGIVSQGIINSYDLTWQGDPTWDFTANDSYFHGETVGYDSVGTFDGSDDRVTIPDVPAFELTGDWTISGWIYADDFNAGMSDSAMFSRWASSAGYMIRFATDRIQLYRNSRTASSGILGGSYDGQWIYLSGVAEGNSGKIYINGELFLDSVFTAGETTQNIAAVGPEICSYSNGAGNKGDCQMAEIQLFSAAKTQAEIQSLMAGELITDDLVDRWAFGDGNGLTVASENGNDGTIVGATSDEFWATKIPAKSKSESLIRSTPSHPAGAYHNRTAAEVTETPVANSDSVNPIYYGADFNGTTSLIKFNGETFNWNNPFKFSFDFMGTNSGTQALFYSQSNGNYSVGNSGGSVRIKINGSFFTHSGSAANDSINTAVFEYTGGIDGTITITLNGVTETFTNDAVSVSQNTNFQFGQTNGGTSPFDGLMRNLYVENNGIVLADCPLYKDSLDRRNIGDPNNGIETDITFLSNAMETDLNPDIAESETRAVTSGDRKIISIGAR